MLMVAYVPTAATSSVINATSSRFRALHSMIDFSTTMDQLNQ